MVKNTKDILCMKAITNLLFGKIGSLDNLIISITNVLEMRIVLKLKLIPKENGMIYVVVKEDTMFVKSSQLYLKYYLNDSNFQTLNFFPKYCFSTK